MFKHVEQFSDVKPTGKCPDCGKPTYCRDCGRPVPTGCNHCFECEQKEVAREREERDRAERAYQRNAMVDARPCRGCGSAIPISWASLECEGCCRKRLEVMERRAREKKEQEKAVMDAQQRLAGQNQVAQQAYGLAQTAQLFGPFRGLGAALNQQPTDMCRRCGAVIPWHQAHCERCKTIQELECKQAAMKNPGPILIPADVAGLKKELERLTFERDRLRSHVAAEVLADFDRIDARQANRQCPECAFPPKAKFCPRCGYARPAKMKVRRRWFGRAGLVGALSLVLGGIWCRVYGYDVWQLIEMIRQ